MPMHAWVVEKKSVLRIDGSSNVSDFTCEITEYMRCDTLWGIQDPSGPQYAFTSNSALTVDIRRFDCHHKYITSDFRKMLKCETYPALHIRFLTLEEPRGGSVVNGRVMVELAGKRKIMDIRYKCEQTGQDLVHLTGDKKMRFGDFELEPPRKVGGLIRINEEITVHFNLLFRKLHS